MRQGQSIGSNGLQALRSWTFITHHAQILLAIARDPAVTVAELAASVAITERTAYRILADLQHAGYVRRLKRGRQNIYEVNPNMPLQDPTVENERVRDLLKLLADEDVEAHGRLKLLADQDIQAHGRTQRVA